MATEARNSTGGRSGAFDVLLTGDVGHGDFRHVVAWLEGAARLEREADLSRAAERLVERPAEGRAAPRLIVVAQSRPGQFAPRQIERLHHAAPLARLTALLGSWCEGEARSGHPWPGVERLYWHEWRARMAPVLAGVGGAAWWRLPRTATAAERLLAQAGPTVSPVRRGLIGIRSASRVGYAALADACGAGGFAAVWLAPRQTVVVEGVDAVVWDGASGDEAEALALEQLLGRVPARAVVALLTFPRLDDHQRMQAAGAGAVLTKPLLSSDLLRELDRLLGNGEVRAGAGSESPSAAPSAA